MVAWSGASPDVVRRLQVLDFRLRSIRWGQAEAAIDQDSWDVLSFFERLLPTQSDALLAKFVAVADFTGSVSRWEILGMFMTTRAPTHLTLLDEDHLTALLEEFSTAVMDGIRPYEFSVIGEPSLANFWKWPKMKRLQNRYRHGDLNAMVSSIVQGHVIHSAVPESSALAVEIVDPYSPVLDVYERGVIPDFMSWRFTNLSGGDLGPLPDPML